MLLLLLLPLSLGSPAPGSGRCTWGPSYWCANIPQVETLHGPFPPPDQASECSAMKHCIKAVWEKQAVPQDDDEVPFPASYDKIQHNSTPSMTVFASCTSGVHHLQADGGRGKGHSYVK